MVRFLGTEEGVHAGPDSTGVESYIVRAEAAGEAAPRLILERVLRTHVTAEDFDAFTRRARRIAMLRHPNVPRVRDVFTTAEHAVVVTEFIEGKRWGSLDARAESQRKPSLSLEVRLKLLLDALSALAALHALREPGWSSTSTGAKVPSMIHGDVAPSSILVGTDGVARLLRIHRVPLHAPTGPLAERTARCAPEILLGDGTADGRADVYSIGVMLWEALSGKRLFTQPTVAEMLSRQLAGDLPAATTSVAWAEPLIEIAAAALAVDPKRRYATAIDLAMAIRNVAGHRVAGASEVARQVAGILGKPGTRKMVAPPPLAAPPPLPTKPALIPVEQELEEEVDLEQELAEIIEPEAPPAELESIDDRWSSLAPEPAPVAAPPAAPPAPPPAPPAPPAFVAPPPVHVMAAPPPPLHHAPLRMTPAPPLAGGTPALHGTPAPPESSPLRPSDITELQARSPRRKRQILIVMFLAALLLFVSVCTTTLLLRPAKAPLAGKTPATSAKPVESAPAPKALAVATPAAPPPAPAPEPAAAPPPPATTAAAPSTSSAPSSPARAAAAAPVRRAAASVAPAAASPKVNAAPAPAAPKAAAPPKSSPPPPPAVRAAPAAKPRPKRSTYVPLGI
ncbi:protein kinase [Pendulispora brunnea]|uniref:Protein kinase n=1 Tax=Pendulispora brunnea TaxID=2905690 RepID=A0ABZ2KIZ4_9BACT